MRASNFVGVRGALVVCALLLLPGCVQQQIVVRSTPTGARTWVNGNAVGVTPVTVPFEWYQQFTIRVEAEGYQRLDRREPVTSPWYMKIPLDLATTLLPWTVVDEHVFEYTLEPTPTTAEETAVHDDTGDARGADTGPTDLRG